MGEYNPEHADPIEIPDALNTDALAAFLETNTEYRIWYNADGDPLLVELGGTDGSDEKGAFSVPQGTIATPGRTPASDGTDDDPFLNPHGIGTFDD